jgi:uncharacterized membrane protein
LYFFWSDGLLGRAGVLIGMVVGVILGDIFGLWEVIFEIDVDFAFGVRVLMEGFVDGIF